MGKDVDGYERIALESEELDEDYDPSDESWERQSQRLLRAAALISEAHAYLDKLAKRSRRAS